MDIDFVKNLVSRVEYLGLDTEVLRDIIKLSYSNEIKLETYSQALHTLDSVLTSRKFESNCQPPQISMVLNQLHKRLENRAEESQAPAKAALITGMPDMMNSEILSSLLDIKSTLANLNVPTTSQPYQSTNRNNTVPEMSTVFVNPIDESKVTDIKSNVTIDSKVGSNIQSKLDKLRNLKKG